jgi:hypothetical protein
MVTDWGLKVRVPLGPTWTVALAAFTVAADVMKRAAARRERSDFKAVGLARAECRREAGLPITRRVRIQGEIWPRVKTPADFTKPSPLCRRIAA